MIELLNRVGKEQRGNKDAHRQADNEAWAKLKGRSGLDNKACSDLL